MITLLLSLVAQADDPALSGGMQLALSIYEMLAPVVAGLLGWIAVRVNAYLKAKTKNTLAAGILGRLNDSVFTAVKRVHQTMASEIRKAKDPKSPGGTKITEMEAKQLREAATVELEHMYGGGAGLEAALKVLGLTGNAATKTIEAKIEAAVHDTKIAVKAVNGNPK